jgi:hypothetical protein
VGEVVKIKAHEPRRIAMDFHETFQWINRKMITKNTQDLINECMSVRSQVIDNLGHNLECPFKINGVELTQAEIRRACLKTITEYPMHLIWRWNVENMIHPSYIAGTIQCLKEYLTDMPGARIEIDPLLKNWLEGKREG